MKNYKETKVIKTEYELTSITCDICNKDFDDIMDIQEFECISSVGGYSSAVGDMVHYEIDMCSKCFVEKLGDYLRFPEEV